MIADESGQLPAERNEPDELERLALALIASVMLHGVVIAWPAGHAPAGRLLAAAHPAPLLAHLVRPEPITVASPPLPPVAPVPESPVSVGATVADDATPLTRKARFATPPEFSTAAAVALFAPARLKLRVHVAPTGVVEMIEVIESRQVPPDFLIAIREDLQGARFLPGESSGRHVASSFTLVIEAEPAADGFPDLSGGVKVTPSR